VGDRYLEGLALWQAEDVLPYQKHLATRAEKGGTRPFFVRPFFGRAGRPWPDEGSPSDRSLVIQAEERRTSQVPALQTWGESSRLGRLGEALSCDGMGTRKFNS